MGGSEPPNCRYGSAKPECRQPKLINPERAMESAGNSRLRVGEQAPPSSRRCARPLSPPGEGAVCGHRGQPKVIHSDMWIEWGNVRLCSPMFAYVRLCSLNGRKNVEGAARGRWGREGRKKEECRMKKAFTGAARGYWDCEMHEMMKGRSRCGTAVDQTEQAKLR